MSGNLGLSYDLFSLVDPKPPSTHRTVNRIRPAYAKDRSTDGLLEGPKEVEEFEVYA
jgi:hypothetical protein